MNLESKFTEQKQSVQEVVVGGGEGGFVKELYETRQL